MHINQLFPALQIYPVCGMSKTPDLCQFSVCQLMMEEYGIRALNVRPHDKLPLGHGDLSMTELPLVIKCI